ncbi:MAG: DUF4397 domain-containing protein [Chlorobiota bacterium]|jgi:hypothetical protein|nr:MAG: DUF4397 domain-containing protein [Chlorobiota bacterium]
MKKLFLILILFITFVASSYAQGSAKIQLIHNCPDLTVAKVDVWINGDKIDDLPFRTATNFIEVPAGPLKISIGLYTSNKESEALVSYSPIVVAGKKYIIAAQGIVNLTGYNPFKPINISIFELAQERAMSSENTDILVLHGSTDAPELDVWAPGSVKAIGDNLNFGDYSKSYFQYPTNDVYVGLREPSGDPLKTTATFSLPMQTMGLGGKSIVIILSGFMKPENNSNGSSFGLYVVTNTGGNFIQLRQSIGGVDNKFNESKISVIPNPVMSNTLIKLNQFGIYKKYNIVNLMGEIQFSEIISNNQKEINLDMTNIISGIYFLQLFSNDNIIQKKIVKIK